jgi:hypothetical protein
MTGLSLVRRIRARPVIVLGRLRIVGAGRTDRANQDSQPTCRPNRPSSCPHRSSPCNYFTIW